MTQIEAKAAALAREARGLVLVLTGAGISAESGIPTFRGPEGYWRIGSIEYRPEELATYAAWRRDPLEIWSWYLYRRAACRQAQPNLAHRALVDLESALGDDFLLVTQNVDGLHSRAGQSRARTYEIHGSIERMRCGAECGAPPEALPDESLTHWPRERRLSYDEAKLLRCTRCGASSRPHVLWFDESYDEEHFRFESTLAAASRAALVLVVGTSGATTLPNHVVRLAAARDAALIVVNAEESPFSELAERSTRGAFLRGTARELVPAVCRVIGA